MTRIKSVVPRDSVNVPVEHFVRRWPGVVEAAWTTEAGSLGGNRWPFPDIALDHVNIEESNLMLPGTGAPNHRHQRI
jgi:hypothetical protein